MTNESLPNNVIYLPDRVIDIVKGWEARPIEQNLLSRSLETPDWTPEQLWEAAAFYHAQSQFRKAMSYYHRLLQWTEHDKTHQRNALQAVGHILLLTGNLKDARDTFRRAETLGEDPKLNYYLADCYFQLKQPQAGESHLRAFLRDYDRQDALLSRAYSRLAALYDARGEFAAAREIYVKAAQQLDSWGFAMQARTYLPLLPTAQELPDVGPVDGSRFFFEELSEFYPYRQIWRQEKVRPLIEAEARKLQARLKDLMPQEKLVEHKAPASGRRIVVAGAFHSADCHPYLDAIVALCRKHSVTLVSTGPLPARLREEEWIRQIEAGDTVLSLYRAIQNHAPELLLYLEVGPRSANLHFLAGLRLAPVQAVFAVHPLTSGLDTLDYFLSFDWLEPEGAQDDYSEKLRLLQGTPARSSGLPDRFIERSSFNLPADQRFYLCPLTCTSIHLAFRDQLAEILRLDPEGQILIPTHSPELDKAFLSGFAGQWPELVQRVHLLPPLQRVPFLSVCREADVLLDPTHTGMSHALWQLIPLGTPIVTWPSGQARGRYAAGLYRQIGITDSVVEAEADYAARAVALARDSGFKADFRARVQEQQRQLFQYQPFLASLESFVTEVLDQISGEATSANELPAAAE